MTTLAPTRGFPDAESRTVPVRTDLADALSPPTSSRQSRTPVLIADMLGFAGGDVKSAGFGVHVRKVAVHDALPQAGAIRWLSRGTWRSEQGRRNLTIDTDVRRLPAGSRTATCYLPNCSPTCRSLRNPNRRGTETPRHVLAALRTGNQGSALFPSSVQITGRGRSRGLRAGRTGILATRQGGPPCSTPH